PKFLLAQDDKWMNSSSFIPCGKRFGEINDLVRTAWTDRLLVERLERKTLIIAGYLEENNQHWEETCWWLLARNFGMKVNTEAFESVARSLPVCLLAKHKNRLQQLEALLLGQASLLEGEWQEDYPLMLQKEYSFLRKK